MKAMHLIIAMLVMMSLASCSADGNDPVENSVSTYLLEKTYGARSVTYAVSYTHLTLPTNSLV